MFDHTRSDGRLMGNDRFLERNQESEDRVRYNRFTRNDIIAGVHEVYEMKQEEL